MEKFKEDDIVLLTGKWSEHENIEWHEDYLNYVGNTAKVLEYDPRDDSYYVEFNSDNEELWIPAGSLIKVES